MANALGQDALQATPDGQSLVNVISDSCGRLLVVSASSNSGSAGGSTAISPSSTWTVTTSTVSVTSLTTTSVIGLSSGTQTIGAISNSSFTVAGAVSITSGTVGLSSAVAVSTATPLFLTTTQPIFPSTSATYPVAVSSAISLTSSSLTIGVLSTSQVVGLTTTSLVALTSSALTIGVLSTAQVVTTSTTSNVGLTTTSLVSLTSSALTIGLLSTTQVSTVVNSSGAQQIGTVALTSGSANPLSTTGTQSTVGVTTSTSVQLLLAPNANRKGAIIYNGGLAVVYVLMASTAIQATTALYTVALSSFGGTNQSYTLPQGNFIYAGGMTAYCGTTLTASTVQVTEFT